MALLTAQILGNKIVGIDIDPLPASIMPEPFRIEDTPSPGYTDISSIVHWHRYGLRKELKRDYGFVRTRVKEIIKAKGEATAIATVNDPTTISKLEGDAYLVGESPVGDFVDQQGNMAVIQADLSFQFKDRDEVGYFQLTEAEREIAIEYNIGNLNDHENDPMVDLTPSQVLALNAEYHRKATANRYYRRYWAETLVYRELPDNNKQVAAEMGYSPKGNLILRYSDHGHRGTVEDRNAHRTDPDEGICDYLKSRGIFAADGDYPGLSSKNWNTRTGRALDDLVDEIYDALIYGIYR